MDNDANINDGSNDKDDKILSQDQISSTLFNST